MFTTPIIGFHGTLTKINDLNYWKQCCGSIWICSDRNPVRFTNNFRNILKKNMNKTHNNHTLSGYIIFLMEEINLFSNLCRIRILWKISCSFAKFQILHELLQCFDGKKIFCLTSRARAVSSGRFLAPWSRRSHLIKMLRIGVTWGKNP